MVRLVGLTGPIACGKSSVSGLLEASGWPVVDADRIAHELLKGGRVRRRVLEAFGPRVLDEQGGAVI